VAEAEVRVAGARRAQDVAAEGAGAHSSRDVAEAAVEVEVEVEETRLQGAAAGAAARQAAAVDLRHRAQHRAQPATFRPGPGRGAGRR
jgi:hypothetical protein